jgi:hypothetical protein
MLVVTTLIIAGWIKDGIPRATEVCRLPNTAIVWRHVENILLPRNAGDRDRTPATKRPNHAPVKFLVHGGVILLGEEREARKKAK